MRVLVTGGSGFIGSHVVDRLCAHGHEPRIFDLVPSPHHGPRQIETVIGDVLDSGALRCAMSGCEAVVHLAAVADVDRVLAEPAHAEFVNARGTEVLLEAARVERIPRVVYASTVWVYGDAPGAEPHDEDSRLGLPRHLYTATKLAGEMYCRAYGELYGLEHTILRLGIPYGPRSRPSAVVAAFVRRALAGEPLTIAGDGTQSRRFVYVEDLAEGFVAALTPPAADRIYNLVGEKSITVRSIAETVRALVGDVRIVYVSPRTADLPGSEVSGVRAARELGWQPTTPFEEGVRRYVAWVTRTNGIPSAATASRTNGTAASVLRQEPREL